MLYLVIQTQIYLCRRVPKPVRLVLDHSHRNVIRFLTFEFEVGAVSWSVLGCRSLPIITSLPVQFQEPPGCLFPPSLCCRHRPEEAALDPVKCFDVRSSQASHVTLSLASSPCTSSPEHYNAQKIAFSKDCPFLFRVVIFHEEVKLTSGVVFENCTCS